MEIRSIDPYSSFTKGPQRTNKQNNSDSEKKNKSVPEEPSLDKIE